MVELINKIKMTNEELLIPRYRVIADYPNNNHFKVGDILMPLKWDKYLLGKFINETIGMAWVSNPEKYPNVLEKLLWWEERKSEEMPMYIKIDWSVVGILDVSIQYWKIKSWEIENGFGRVDDSEGGVITMKLVEGCMLLSTEEEYLQNKK